MGKKTNRKETLRAQQIKRRQTIQRRSELFSQIRENVSGQSEAAANLISKPKTKAVSKEIMALKVEQKLSLTKKEKQMQNQLKATQKMEFINPVYSMSVFADPQAAAPVEQPIPQQRPLNPQAKQSADDGSGNAVRENQSKIERQQITQQQADDKTNTQERAQSQQVNPLELSVDFPEKHIKITNCQVSPKQAISNLPIAFKQFEITEALNNSDILILKASTGTGKSTQLPQFLLSDGYTFNKPGYQHKIFVTQPRKIAALGLQQRVALEWGNSKQISYAVRGASNAQPETKVLYATEGVLMEMLKKDQLLLQLSVLILDEAHERSQQMDILFQLALVIQRERRKQFDQQCKNIQKNVLSLQEFEKAVTVTPLKLIIMSATLQLQNYSVDGSALIEIDQKTFPVAIHYEKQENSDAVSLAVEKALFLHNNYPPGQILIFMSGMNEILSVCSEIRKKLSIDEPIKNYANEHESCEELNEISLEQQQDKAADDSQRRIFTEEELNQIEMPENADEADLILKEQLQQENKHAEEHKCHLNLPNTVVILPLYSQLPLSEQQKIYNKYDRKTTRVFIVATNIAESSITVPDVRYVIDSCYEKVKVQRGLIQQLQRQFAAVSSLIQRSGRAGRTQAGHCFRLVTPGQFGALKATQEPELNRLDIQNVIMQLLSLGIDPLHFTYPADFNRECVIQALNQLILISAVVKVQNKPRLTKFGVKISNLPVCVTSAAICAFAPNPFSAAVAAAIQTDCFSQVQLFGEDDFSASGKMLFSYREAANKMAFCRNNQLSIERMREALLVFSQLLDKLSLSSAEYTKGDEEQARRAVIFVLLGNFAVLENEKFGRYQVERVDLRSHTTSDVIIQKLDESQSAYLDTAVVDRRSALRASGARFLLYQQLSLSIRVEADKLLISSVICRALTISLAELLPLAEVSTRLHLSLPKAVIYRNAQILALVDVSFNGIEIGEAEVGYPGRGAEELDNERLIARARVLLLARGDYGVKIQASFQVREQFGKGLPSCRQIDEAASCLTRERGDFLQNNELLRKLEDILK